MSYSDLVKSWRGECGGIGIGPYYMHSVPYMYVCTCTRRHAKVIVSARSPLYMMGGYVTKGVGRRLLYKVLERRPRSQCVVVMAVNGCMLNAM